jgi:predicted secreted Zn-dependent protease
LDFTDLVHYTMEMAQGLQQMTECLLARQEEAAQIATKLEEMKAYINAPVAARQDKADAEAKTCHDQFKEDIKGHMEPCLEVLRKRQPR